MLPTADDDLSPTEGLPTRSGPGGDAGEGSLATGERLGRYRIDGLLGRGGMGEVYRAEQLEPVLRTVALKLMNARRLDARHLAYFEVERQMLAQMKHPAIAQVFDAGATPDGHPYFAMEFIEGSPLTTYCEQHRLPLRERLELFVRVCEGVQHAHQRGVIHRDLKPGNILVTEIDGRALPKIIDFGIATAASRSLAAGEYERAGTPDYMSPEQAGLEPGTEIDTRSDVYSLGVLLYELLAGSRPGSSNDTDKGIHTAAGTTLQPPSAQIDTRAPGLAQARAEQLGLSAPRMRRVLRHELDWVVLKAMRRDRALRYDSAAALADDLRRFLQERPLAAVPATRRYVAGKWLRRHRLGFAAASAVAVAVLAGLAMSLYGLQQANQQRAVAEARRAELERVSAFQQEMLEGIDIQGMGASLSGGLRDQLGQSAPDLLPQLEQVLSRSSPTDLARAMISRDVLASALATIDRDFADRPDLAADLRESVANVQETLGLYAEAAANAQAVADYRTDALGVTAPGTLRARLLQAQAMSGTSEVAEAVALIEKTRSEAGGLPEFDRLRVELDIAYAQGLSLLGERDRAQQLQQQTYDRLLAARGADDEMTMSALNNLAISFARRGETDEARAAFERLFASRVSVLGAEHEDTLATMSNLAILSAMNGDLDEALALHRQLVEIQTRRLGREHPMTLSERGNLANTLSSAGELEEAEAEMRAVLAGRERITGTGSRDSLRTKLNLASVLVREERVDEGLALEKEVLDGRLQLLGPKHPDTVFIQVNHGGTLHRAGRDAEALVLLRAVVPVAREVLGDRNPQTQTAVFLAGLLELMTGHPAEAVPRLRLAMQLQGAADGAEDHHSARAAWALAEALDRVGQGAEAQELRARYVAPLRAKPAGELEDGERRALESIDEEASRLRRSG